MLLVVNADIAGLARRYQELHPPERRRYNEAQTRKDFIDPLFASLGWDMHGIERHEVEVETHVSGGRADYAFKIGGAVRFYLEAKRLEDDLYNPEYAQQVITYAYNRGVTWAVLCNFVGLQVFNAEWETTDLNRARVLNLTWEQYRQPDSPLRLLSRGAFLNNELDRHAQTFGGMRPRLPVEKSLYAQLRHWRERLFNEIARLRPELTREQVDEAIQRLLNRLIFIRTCEDRRIEEARLRAALRHWQPRGSREGLAATLEGIFRDFDGYYDSELFAPLAWADQILLLGTVLDDALDEVLRGLYEPPTSLAAYDFSVIDADVLGQVYEQYLGHVAQVAKARAAQAEMQARLGIEAPQIQLEAKRQKRKEHGIYYTPKWVVDYIVRQTVGRYLEEHSYNDVLNVKILDPACGSGSFLIRAFDTLLEYHARVKGKAVAELDQYERLRILTGNIYGVDLDQQAVEIARLNLLLRSLARRERLPFLSGNVRRGNSLISGAEAELRPYFGDGWREKQPFDWEREFPDIMARDGFDIVIGNPPYIRVDSLPEDDKRLFKDKFLSAVGKYDAYYLFLELALKLVREGGTIGFITPNRFCTNTTGEKLRNLLLSEGHSVEVTSVSRLPVFEEAVNYPVVTIVHRDSGKAKGLVFFDPKDVSEIFSQAASYRLTEGELTSLPRRIMPINVTDARLKLALRVSGEALPAGQVLKIQEGLRIPVTHEQPEGTSEEQLSIIKQFQFSRYSTIKAGSFLRQEDLESLFSKSAQRVVNSRKPKLIFAEDALRVEGTLDTSGGLCQGGVYFATLLDGKPYDLLYLLGLFNSALLTFVFKSFYSGIHMGGGFLRFRTEYLEELPLRLPDMDTPGERKLHDSLVARVERMLALHGRLAAKGDVHDEERAQIERDIAHTDREIDVLVYDLYGLTQEERRLVEGAVA